MYYLIASALQNMYQMEKTTSSSEKNKLIFFLEIMVEVLL